VLIAVESLENSRHICGWLARSPFHMPMEATVLTAIAAKTFDFVTDANDLIVFSLKTSRMRSCTERLVWYSS
jgi:hypothetical protein